MLVEQPPQQQVARVRVRPALPGLELRTGRGRSSEELVVVPGGARLRPHRLVVLRQRAVVAHAARVVEQPPHRVELDRALAHEQEHRRRDGRLRDAVDRVPRIRVAGDLDVVADGDERGDAHGSCQNSPMSPSRSRIAWFCSRVCGRQSGAMPVVPPGVARARRASPPRSSRPAPCPPSQRAMCSSDRKRFIPLQVKTMSSHQCAAGTRTWKRSDSSSARSSRTSTTSGSPQSGHDVSIRPSACSAAQMPNASQAQLPYHQRPRGLHPVRGRHDRERVEHPQLVRRRIEDDGVLRVEPPPAGERPRPGRRAPPRPARGRARRRTRTSAAAARDRSSTIPRRYTVPAVNEELLDRYADLIVGFGANVQPDQVVAVEGPPEAAPLVHRIARRAYERGARYVDVVYFDPLVKRIRNRAAAEDSLVLGAAVARPSHARPRRARRGPDRPQPDRPAGAPRRDRPGAGGPRPAARAVRGGPSRSSTTAPSPGRSRRSRPRRWAQIVFPELEPAAAVDALWRDLEHVCRLDEPDPVDAWRAPASRRSGRPRLASTSSSSTLCGSSGRAPT